MSLSYSCNLYNTDDSFQQCNIRLNLNGRYHSHEFRDQCVYNIHMDLSSSPSRVHLPNSIQFLSFQLQTLQRSIVHSHEFDSIQPYNLDFWNAIL